jgi:trehalose/maltose hydrolase-like predicted phosphorylase
VIEGQTMDSWILTATEPTDGTVYLANGYLGTTLPWDAGLLAQSEPAPCYVRGLYVSGGTDGIDRLAHIPCWYHLRYGAPASVLAYRRDLDLRHGIVRTTITLREARGEVRIEHSILFSRTDRYLAAMQVTVTPEFDGEITFVTGLAPPGQGDSEVLEARPADGGIELRSRTRTYGIEIGQVLRIEEVGWTATDSVDGGVTRVLRAAGQAGEPLTLTQVVRTVSGLDEPHPLQSARQVGGTFERIRAAHEESWERLWQTDIEIDGDPQVQRFARAGLYYLWSTVGESDRWSIAPMGLSSNFYNGHIFWDAELWMYPPLLVTQPAMGYSCVAYRRHTLPAALARAAAGGYRGARFPWEAAFTGEEMTPFWADTRDFQLHITADVAIGQWWYYLTTRDPDWLRSEGFPVIRACAEYWASRVEHNAQHDRYELSDVVCADEYAAHVNNDAFTNAAVRAALLIAIRAAELVGEDAPPEWATIAQRMYVPYDPEQRRHLEFDGYDGRITKQADVELLAYPLEYVTDREQIARDLDYYATVIDPNGPAMSFSIYAILSAQLGRSGDAYEYLRRSYLPNTRSPFYAFSETPTNDEFLFCTGVGGALQALLFGFSGLRLHEGYFALDPLLPQHWRALRLRGLFLDGARTDIEILPESVTVRRHLGAGVVELRLDRRTGQVQVETEGIEPSGLSVVIEGTGDRGVQREAIDSGQAVMVMDRGQGAIRLRVVEEHTPLLEVLLPGSARFDPVKQGAAADRRVQR